MRELTAKDIMTYDVLQAKADWSLSRLAEFLVENSISGAPVISEDGKLVGVVSVTDILCHDIVPEKNSQPYGAHEFYLHTIERQFAKQEIESMHFENEPQTTTSDIMTTTIFNVGEETRAQEVADTMIRSHIHRVFVTRENKVVGIISAVDMLEIIRDL